MRHSSTSRTPTEQCSVIPCTQDCTYCFIHWNEKRLTIKSGSVGFSYPFHKCSIRSMWEERMLNQPQVTHRRAVLVLKGFTEWHYTLAPECHHDEPILSLLATELEFTAPVPSIKNGVFEGTQRKLAEEELKALKEKYSASVPIKRVNLGPLTTQFLKQHFGGETTHCENEESVRLSQFDREKNQSWRDIRTLRNRQPWISKEEASGYIQEELPIEKHWCCTLTQSQQREKRKKPRYMNAWDKTQESIERMQQLQNEGSAATELTLVKPLTELANRVMSFIGELCERCQQPELKHKLANSPDLIFSDKVLWGEEPILPVQLYLIRHGQQSSFNGSIIDVFCPSSELGKIQSMRTSELLYQWTNGFKGTNMLSVISSELQRSKETADIIWHYIKSLNEENSSDGCSRRSHPHLGEYLPMYNYQVEGDESQVKEELDKDSKSQNEAYWLLSAALRGLRGPLIPALRRGEYRPLDLCGHEIHLLNMSPSIVQRYRFPALNIKDPLNVWGVLLGPSTVTQNPMENGRSVSVVYSGHGNTIKNFIIREMGLPRHLWKHMQLPHCSVVLTGLHHSGRPSFMIADAGYLALPLKGDPLPITFTPIIRSEELPTKDLSYKNRLATDQMVTLLAPYDEGSPRFEGVSGNVTTLYERPREPSPIEKYILLIRTGQNVFVNCRDVGLTKIGVQQLESAAEWICLFLKSSRVIDCPTYWCAAGLISNWSSIDLTLKESLVIINEQFEKHLPSAVHDPSLLPNQESLYPESLFASSSVDGILTIIVADDYHLLKYFGCCFGIDPFHLQYAFWPHAGHVLITIVETGWPELRTFGTISHLHPSEISILPSCVEDQQETDERLPQETSPANFETYPENLESRGSLSLKPTFVKNEPNDEKPPLLKMFPLESFKFESEERSPNQIGPPVAFIKATVPPKRPLRMPQALGPKASPKASAPTSPEVKPLSKMTTAPPAVVSREVKIEERISDDKEFENRLYFTQIKEFQGPTVKKLAFAKAPSPDKSLDFKKSDELISLQHPTVGETPRSTKSSEDFYQRICHGDVSVPPSADEESFQSVVRTEYFSPATDDGRKSFCHDDVSSASFASFTPEHRRNEIIDKPDSKGQLDSFEPLLNSSASEDSLEKRMEREFAEQDKSDDEPIPYQLKPHE